MGEKGLPGKKAYHSTASVRSGASAPTSSSGAWRARARLSRPVGGGRDRGTCCPPRDRTVPGRRDAEAVDRITKTAASLQRNPVELLALEGLLVRLGDDGE